MAIFFSKNNHLLITYTLKLYMYFADSKMDGLDDALLQQTQLESFLPTSGCAHLKSGNDILAVLTFATLLLLH